MCMRGLPIYMYAPHLYAAAGSGVTDECGLTCGYLELNLGLLEERYVPLTID